MWRWMLGGLGVVGCADPGSMLRHERGFPVSAGALELGSNPADLHVVQRDPSPVMLRLDVETGAEVDRFAPGGMAQIVDVGDNQDQDLLLLMDGELVRVSGQSASTVRKSSGSAEVLGGGLIDGEPVSLERWASEGCVVIFGEAEPLVIDDAACSSPALATADEEGLLLITNPGGTWAVSPDGAVGWQTPGELIAWEPLAGAVVTAMKNDTELRATLPDGFELWATAIGERLLDFDVIGTGGDLLLVTSPGDVGRLVHLDAISGQAVRAVDLPLVPTRLSAAWSGNAVALAFPDEVHVFSVVLLDGTEGGL